MVAKRPSRYLSVGGNMVVLYAKLKSASALACYWWGVSEASTRFRGKFMPSSALQEITEGRRLSYLREYFDGADTDAPRFTGSQFESFLAESQDPNQIAPADLLAVSMLSVNVPAAASLKICGSLQEKITVLLSCLPVELKFEELTDQEFEEYLGARSPAEKLWNLLRQKDGTPWGIGQTTASKILARKRPHLIPIYDSVIANITRMPNSLHQWTRWRAAFASNATGQSSMQEQLTELRAAAGLTQISLLRTLDVVLWMEGRGKVKRTAVR